MTRASVLMARSSKRGSHMVSVQVSWTVLESNRIEPGVEKCNYSSNSEQGPCRVVGIPPAAVEEVQYVSEAQPVYAQALDEPLHGDTTSFCSRFVMPVSTSSDPFPFSRIENAPWRC